MAGHYYSLRRDLPAQPEPGPRARKTVLTGDQRRSSAPSRRTPRARLDLGVVAWSLPRARAPPNQPRARSNLPEFRRRPTVTRGMTRDALLVRAKKSKKKTQKWESLSFVPLRRGPNFERRGRLMWSQRHSGRKRRSSYANVIQLTRGTQKYTMKTTCRGLAGDGGRNLASLFDRKTNARAPPYFFSRWAPRARRYGGNDISFAARGSLRILKRAPP
ncbi:hypothetical protein MRX96_013329 [Rhipicephalus microplus]